MDEYILPITIAVLTLATLGHAIFGFGGGLIAIPILSILIGVREAVTLSLVQQMVTVILLSRTLRHVDWQITAPLLVGMLPGTIAGIAMLSSLNDTVLRVSLSVFIFLYLVKSIGFPNLVLAGIRHRGWGAFAGFLGGSFQGLIGTGGPPVVMYLNETASSKNVFRAGLLLLLAVSNIVRLGISVPAGLFTDSVIEASLYTMPFFLIAMWIGDKLMSRIDEKHYTNAVYVVLTISLILLLAEVVRS